MFECAGIAGDGKRHEKNVKSEGHMDGVSGNSREEIPHLSLKCDGKWNDLGKKMMKGSGPQSFP